MTTRLVKLPFLTQEYHRWRWLYTPCGKVMHRVLSYDREKDTDDAPFGAGAMSVTFVCDIQSPVALIPGLGDRFGGKRCQICCKRLKIPTGYGIPVNAKIDDPDEVLVRDKEASS